MKKLILIIFLLSLSGCGLGAKNISVPYSDVISYKEVKKGECLFFEHEKCNKAKEDLIEYKYKVKAEKNVYDGMEEVLEERSSTTELYYKGNNQYVLKQYLKPVYFEENGEWKKIVQATTSLKDFDKTKVEMILGDTDTGSSLDDEGWGASWNTTFVGGTDPVGNWQVAYRSYPGSGRSWVRFTLSAGSGTISDVVMKLKSLAVYTAQGTTEAHALTQTGWIGNQASWNNYKTGTAWASAGGDFNATVIDSITDPTAGNWGSIVLMGTGATNPLTLTWSDTINILLKQTTESGGEHGWAPYGGDSAGNEPYLEITYTSAAVAVPGQIIIID